MSTALVSMMSGVLGNQGFLLSGAAVSLAGELQAADLVPVTQLTASIVAELPPDSARSGIVSLTEETEPPVVLNGLGHLLERIPPQEFVRASVAVRAKLLADITRFAMAEDASRKLLAILRGDELLARLEEAETAFRALKSRLIAMIQSELPAVEIYVRTQTALDELGELVAKLVLMRDAMVEADELTPAIAFKVRRFRHDDFGRDATLIGTLTELAAQEASAELDLLWHLFSPLSPKLVSLVKRSAEKLQRDADRRMVEINYGDMTEGNMALSLDVDLELVAGILDNLLDNGIKYSDPLKPKRYVKFAFDPSRRVLTCRDNGIGMDAAFVRNFGKISQREGRAEGVSGTGAGAMIIAINLASLGWAYEIESEQGKGTVFRITIPEDVLISASSITHKSMPALKI